MMETFQIFYLTETIPYDSLRRCEIFHEGHETIGWFDRNYPNIYVKIIWFIGYLCKSISRTGVQRIDHLNA